MRSENSCPELPANILISESISLLLIVVSLSEVEIRHGTVSSFTTCENALKYYKPCNYFNDNQIKYIIQEDIGFCRIFRSKTIDFLV